MYHNYIINLINVNTHTKLSVHHKKTTIVPFQLYNYVYNSHNLKG